MLTDLLDLRSSFVVATMFVSWVAVALLALVVGNLYRRLQRLESSLSVSAGAPYAHLLGRRLWECLGETVPLPCVLVFLSANCAACRRVLGELPSLSFSAPLAIAWTDHSAFAAPRAAARHHRPRQRAERRARRSGFASHLSRSSPAKTGGSSRHRPSTH